MAKKVVSVVLHKQKKPIKHISRRKKLRTALKKIFNYMKSDTYMFAPLLHPQSKTTLGSPVSTGEVSCEPILKIKKNGKKLTLEDVEGYLKCDCYMYAPLVVNSASDNHATSPIEDECRGKKDHIGSVSHEMEQRTKETIKQDGKNNVSSSGDINDDDGSYSPRRRIAVRHMQLRREKVKRVIPQNCRPSSTVAEKVLSQKEPRDIVVE